MELGRIVKPSEGQRGAALVEFAILLPLLLVVVMGIIEFGYALAQQLDVRHGARETSRLIAVDNFDLNTACDRMELSIGVIIDVTRASDTVGDDATANVTANLNTLTGFFDGWLPSTLSSEVKVRIEQPPNWPTGPQACP